MISRVSRVVLVLFIPCVLCGSSRFLHADPALKAAEVRQELQGVLEEFLGQGHGVNDAHLAQITEAVKPVFHALPKNNMGRLSAQVMRYAVQRYFSQEHGWIVKGFEPHAKAANSSGSDSHILQSKLPDYVRTALEEKFSHHGFGLEDTAIMVAAIQRLIFDEVIRGVERAFRLNEMPPTQELSSSELMDVLESYLITEMLEGADDFEQHKVDKENILELYPHWDTTKLFVTDIQLNDNYMQQSRQNPFAMRKPVYFEDATRIAQRMSEQFGTWSNHECVQIKDSLTDMDKHHTGRVKVADFYGKSLNGGWQFRESPGYLRLLGALDESSILSGPQVIIPNYVSGMSNCITSTPYYSICCINECDRVYQHLESRIPHPTASVEQIIGAVESMARSPTGISAKIITASLRQKLEDVAALHNGNLPLHGRLIAQWLHYAFPQECPYPHVSDTIKPVTPMKYEEIHGEDTTAASDDEVQQYLEAESARVAPSPEAGADMWNLHEDILLASTPSDAHVESVLRKALRLAAYLGMIGGFGVLLLKVLLPALKEVGKYEKVKVEYDV